MELDRGYVVSVLYGGSTQTSYRVYKEERGYSIKYRTKFQDYWLSLPSVYESQYLAEKAIKRIEEKALVI